MPNWSTAGNPGFLVAPPATELALPPAPKIDVGVGKKFEEEFAARLGEIAGRSEATPGKESGLVIDQIGRDPSLVLLGADGMVEAEAGSLAEIRRLIAAKEYAQALALVDRVLSASPSNLGARYLGALCQFSLRQLEPALESLGKVPRVGLDGPLDSQVRLLRSQVRTQLTPRVMIETAVATASGEAAAAVSRLERLIVLDPEGAVFHLLLAHTLMNVDRLEAAARVVRQAEPYCTGADRATLRHLEQEIERRDVRDKLRPARDLFRGRQYRRARSSMKPLRSQYGHFALWRTFHAYLEALGGGVFARGRSPREVSPQGSPKEVDELYFFLVETEIREARSAIDERDFAAAEHSLERAQELAPRFQFASFLLALCRYEAVIKSFTSGTPPSPAEVRSRLAAARSLAKVAATDPEIKQAPQLLAAIDSAIQALDAAERDAKIVDPLASELRNIVSSANDGIRSPEQFRNLQRRLKRLREQVVAAERQASSRQTKGTLHALSEAVSANSSQLEKMEPEVVESEKLAALHKELESVMNGVQGGIRSPEQFRETKRRMTALREKIHGTKLKGPDAIAALKQLADHVKEALGQLLAIEAQVNDAESLNSFTDRLNAELVALGSTSAAGKRGETIVGLTQLKAEVGRFKVRSGDASSRQRLAELSRVIDQTLKVVAGRR